MPPTPHSARRHDGCRPCPACGTTSSRVVQPHLYGDCALLRCEACGSELLSPQPSDERLTEIYGRRLLRAVAAEEARRRRLDQAPDVRADARLMPASDPAHRARPRVRDRIVPRRSHRPGRASYGIDLNGDAIATAQARVPDVDFHAGVAADQPFPGVQFDAIVMVDFIEHVRDPAAELSIVREWMHAVPWVEAGHLHAALSIPDAWASGAWPQYREEHLAYFSRAGLVALMSRAGLRVDVDPPTRKTSRWPMPTGRAVAYPVPGLSGVTTQSPTAHFPACVTARSGWGWGR